MPRSSRHKSSKHSSRDARDYSDSERESSLKESKIKDESSARVSKESGSGDKRKLDTKDHYDSVNGEYYEDYSSSKPRKGKIGDSANDRWNGKDDDKGESSRKSKASSEKSRRKEEVEGEETKKSSGKSDGKHRESSRRESKEFDKEKDRDRGKKYKEGKSDKFYDGEDHHGSKVVSDKTESKAKDSENHPEKRSRRKRDDHGTGSNHVDDVAETHLTSGDDYIKDGRQKGEKCKDKYLEDKEEDIKPKGDKHKDERPKKEHPRADEKLFKDESKRKSKVQDKDRDSEIDGYHDRPLDYERSRDYEKESDKNERDHKRAREHDRDYERDRDRDRDWDRNRDRDRERDYDRRDYDHERDWDRDRSRDCDRDRDRERTHDREKHHSRDYHHDRKRSKSEHERDYDRDVSRLNGQSGRNKDRREDKRSPEYQDDLSDSKPRVITDQEDMGSRSSRPEPGGDTLKSDGHPSSSVVQEDIGNALSSREAAELSGGSERGTKYRVSEKPTKMEDGVLGEYPVERSSTTKASPRPMIERSPSSTSFDRRCTNGHGGARRSLEIEESGYRRNARDSSAAEDRLSRDIPPDRVVVDETSQAELSFNNKAHQNNSSFPPRPESRNGISSPKVGSLEEDNRTNTGGRYKRGLDAIMGRGQSNMWRGGPNWASPVPNGFMPFQHVPSHGGFQSMMPQFPSPSLFGVRPSMEISHSGIPYHVPDSERFSGHMRPLGWQNMMDGSGASHMHGFFGDMSNGIFRDESHIYGGSEWDPNRRMHGRGWESGTDEWKTRNGDSNMEVSSMSAKDDNSAQVADDTSLAGQTSHSENMRAKSVEAGSNLTSPAKELHVSSPNIMAEVVPEDLVTEITDNAEHYGRHYLSKIDISVELADSELHDCMSLLIDEARPTIDDEISVFVNLKEGGKTVPKSDCTSLTALSLFPTKNSSLFQKAMNLYKEQRFEMKGLPNVGNQGSQSSSTNLVEVDTNGVVNDLMEGKSSIEMSNVKNSDVTDTDTPQTDLPSVSHVDAKMEIETQGGSLSPNPDHLPEALVAEGSDPVEDSLQNAKLVGDSVDLTMETACGVQEGDHVAMKGPVSSPVDMETDEKNTNLVEEKEAYDEGLVVGSVSPKVTEPLVHESDESVISRINHSPQSTQ